MASTEIWNWRPPIDFVITVVSGAGDGLSFGENGLFVILFTSDVFPADLAPRRAIFGEILLMKIMGIFSR